MALLSTTWGAFAPPSFANSTGTAGLLAAFRLRRSRKKTRNAITATRPKATPAPMPAFAPVPSPELLVAGGGGSEVPVSVGREDPEVLVENAEDVTSSAVVWTALKRERSEDCHRIWIA